MALPVHLLAQRGELSLDDRVAEYWPRLGQHGKESVTIRQLLQHRSLSRWSEPAGYAASAGKVDGP